MKARNINGHAVVPLTSKNIHAHRPVTFDTPPDRITNASQREAYKTPVPYVRNDGHKDIKSLTVWGDPRQ